jgi:hypothetical protein
MRRRTPVDIMYSTCEASFTNTAVRAARLAARLSTVLDIPTAARPILIRYERAQARDSVHYRFTRFPLISNAGATRQAGGMRGHGW